MAKPVSEWTDADAALWTAAAADPRRSEEARAAATARVQEYQAGKSGAPASPFADTPEDLAAAAKPEMSTGNAMYRGAAEGALPGAHKLWTPGAVGYADALATENMRNTAEQKAMLSPDVAKLAATLRAQGATPGDIQRKAAALRGQLGAESQGGGAGFMDNQAAAEAKSAVEESAALEEARKNHKAAFYTGMGLTSVLPAAAAGAASKAGVLAAIEAASQGAAKAVAGNAAGRIAAGIPGAAGMAVGQSAGMGDIQSPGDAAKAAGIGTLLHLLTAGTGEGLGAAYNKLASSLRSGTRGAALKAAEAGGQGETQIFAGGGVGPKAGGAAERLTKAGKTSADVAREAAPGILEGDMAAQATHNLQNPYLNAPADLVEGRLNAGMPEGGAAPLGPGIQDPRQLASVAGAINKPPGSAKVDIAAARAAATRFGMPADEFDAMRSMRGMEAIKGKGEAATDAAALAGSPSAFGRFIASQGNRADALGRWVGDNFGIVDPATRQAIAQQIMQMTGRTFGMMPEKSGQE